MAAEYYYGTMCMANIGGDSGDTPTLIPARELTWEHSVFEIHQGWFYRTGWSWEGPFVSLGDTQTEGSKELQECVEARDKLPKGMWDWTYTTLAKCEQLVELCNLEVSFEVESVITGWFIRKWENGGMEFDGPYTGKEDALAAARTKNSVSRVAS